MAWWEMREHWRQQPPLTFLDQLWLLQIDDVFVQGWRVEWPGHRHRPGVSFTNHKHQRPADRERLAREFLTARMAELGGEWQRVDHG